MRKLALVAFVLLGILAWFAFDALQAAGHFKTIEPHFEGSCRPVGGMPGPEDITVHPETGIAFISSTDRRAQRTGQRVRGAIYALELGSAEPKPKKLTGELDIEFQPHGLSLFRGPEGQEALFAVSHPRGSHAIEVFDVREGSLLHRETLTDDHLRSPNDILAVGPRQFYATNDHRYQNGFRRTAEEFLRRAESDIVYYDGNAFRVVAENVAYPNGITISPDGLSVYVASTTGRAVLWYDRDPDTGSLSFRESYDTGTGVDNLEVASDGTVWIGAHPQMLAFLKNARDAKSFSPSQVLSFDPTSGAFREEFLSLGDDLSTSSVAAVYEKWLLIGSVYEEHILLCEIP